MEFKIDLNKTSYSNMIDYVFFVVQNSFGKEDNEYHKYLREFYETIAVLTMYTDYDGSFNYDTAMDYRNSKDWDVVVDQLGARYYTFKRFIDDEIKKKTMPFASIKEILVGINTLIANANRVVGAINEETLSSLNIESLINAVDAISKTGIGDNQDMESQGEIVEFPADAEAVDSEESNK